MFCTILPSPALSQWNGMGPKGWPRCPDCCVLFRKATGKVHKQSSISPWGKRHLDNTVASASKSSTPTSTVTPTSRQV